MRTLVFNKVGQQVSQLFAGSMQAKSHNCRRNGEHCGYLGRGNLVEVPQNHYLTVMPWKSLHGLTNAAKRLAIHRYGFGPRRRHLLHHPGHARQYLSGLK